MNYRRDHRASRASLFDNMDGLEEGGLRSSSSYSIGMDDHDNEKTMDSLHDRVSFLKRLTGDIHEEVETHNRMLDRMELCLEQWIDLKRCLKRNQIREYANLQDILWLLSLCCIMRLGFSCITCMVKVRLAMSIQEMQLVILVYVFSGILFEMKLRKRNPEPCNFYYIIAEAMNSRA